MKDTILNIFLILIGNFLIALAVTCLIIPNNILSGGLAGIAVALQPVLPFIETTTFISVSTIALFVFGAFCLGKEFLVKTLISAIAYPIFLNLLSALIGNQMFTDSPLLASIYTGILVGIGIGLVFRTGSSTGGVDILALISEKYLKIPAHIGCLIIDGATVILGVSTYSIHAAMIGLISVFVTSFMIDKTISFGGEKTKSVLIISDKYEEILKIINEEIDRGATLLHGEGSFSREQKEVILCVIDNKQYPKLNVVVNNIDKNAFLIVQDAREVSGNGFTYYKEIEVFKREAFKKKNR